MGRHKIEVWTPTTVIQKKIYHLLLKKKGDAEISEKVGCVRQYVAQIRERFGIVPEEKKSAYNHPKYKKRLSQIASLSKQGLSARKIGKIMGLTDGTVYGLAKYYGLDILLRHPHSFTEADYRKAFKTSGGNYHETARIMGIHPQKAERWGKKFGLKSSLIKRGICPTITPIMKKSIIKYLGESVSEVIIAKKFDLVVNDILRIKKGCKRSSHAIYNKKTKDKACRMFQQGKSVHFVSEKLNIPVFTAYGWRLEARESGQA